MNIQCYMLQIFFTFVIWYIFFNVFKLTISLLKPSTNSLFLVWDVITHVINRFIFKFLYEIINKCRIYQWIVCTNSYDCLRLKKFPSSNKSSQNIIFTSCNLSTKYSILHFLAKLTNFLFSSLFEVARNNSNIFISF